MAAIIGMVSQKGGVGKSTLARLIAREYAAAGWNVKIADLNIAQGTSYNWQQRRLQNNVQPEIAVERFGTVEQAIKATATQYDLVVLDAPPDASAGTLKIAQHSDLVVLPTGLSLDDLEPSVLLAHEMVKKSVPKTRIIFALCRVGDSDTEIVEARVYIEEAGYKVLKGELPERLSYRSASDAGRALTETHVSSLKARADMLAQSVVNLITKLENTRKAANG